MPVDRIRDAVARVRVRLLYRADRVRSRLFHPTTLGSRIMLVRDGRVLLVRHSYRGGWFLPGGGLTRGESFESAARREALEEAGATIGSLRLHGLYLNRSEEKVDHVAVFVATDFEVGPARSAEIDDVRWFSVDALPPNTARGTADRIDEFRRGGGPFSGPW